MPQRLDFGKEAEETAVEFLKEKGYNILSRNFRVKLGEIDIIAKDGQTICFIEVKARHSQECGFPEEAVERRKQRQIAKAAFCYLKENNLFESQARFDVVSLLYNGNLPQIHLIQDAFELSPSFML